MLTVSFLMGLLFFSVIIFGGSFFNKLGPLRKTENVGIQGSFTINNLPSNIIYKAARGLTVLDTNGVPKPDLTSSWEIKDNGKTYVFHLKKDILYVDHSKFTSESVNYNFLDVTVEKPDKYTIIFKLKDRYSPFLVTVSKPILKSDLIGVGSYKMTNVNLNGDYVNSFTLDPENIFDTTLNYQFYPTENALKSSFALGETSKILGLSDLKLKNQNFLSFPGVIIEKRTNYNSLVSLFYNTKDKILSDKKLRQALSYSVPNNFKDGERGYGPFPPSLWANSGNNSGYLQDFEHAKLLLSQSQATGEAKLKLKITTLSKYENDAKAIVDSWKSIGVNADIQIVPSLPQSFQIFLGEFNVPKDPDQYTIWHSDQINNITGYKNLRIDKLLEDGRQTVDTAERKKIYSDFQKYLLDDAPGTFLFFPYSYTVSKK